jgi:hypothetical protein
VEEENGGEVGIAWKGWLGLGECSNCPLEEFWVTAALYLTRSIKNHSFINEANNSFIYLRQTKAKLRKKLNYHQY